MLIDTSAWVEVLRATGSATDEQLARLLADRSVPLHTTEPVHMELLAGARSDAHASDLRDMLAGCEPLPISDLDQWEQAAAIYQTCRRHGVTPRGLIDCLIAAVAIDHDVEVFHADHDFRLIARWTTLRIVDCLDPNS